MIKRAFMLAVCLCLSLCARAIDLPTASSDDLLKIYAQLRSLHGGDQSAAAEQVVWKRDAATFKFSSGRIALAEPVAGHVVAAYFEGKASVEIQAPTPALQRQLERSTGGSAFTDEFEKAVFFFTDDSLEQLQNLVRFRPGEDHEFATAPLALEQKKLAQSFNSWWTNRQYGNPNMRNMPARMLADLTDPSSKGFFFVDFKTRHHGDLIYQVSWNRDSLLFPDLANDEEVALVHYNRDDYSEWLGGFHLATEYANNPWPEHRTLLAHCRQENIDAEIAKNNRLSATAALEFAVPKGSARVLSFGLESVLRISSITDANGQKVAFIQEPRELDSDPWLILPEPAAAGKTYNYKIAYAEDSTLDSRVVYHQGVGLFYVTARESWFPSFGAFDDRTHFTMHFVSPKKYQFVATGRLVKSDKGKDGYDSDWDTDVPLGVVGFNYGDFVEKSKSDSGLNVTAYAGREIPDELKELSAQFDLAQLAGGPDGDKDVAGHNGISEGGFNTAAGAQFAAALSLQSLRLFDYYFGHLPFKTISVTEQPIRGYGQSWPTLIFLPYDSLLDATTRHQLRIANSAEALEFYNIVAIHEMAHQWWGHEVGWRTYRDQWMSEGFAEFSASLYLQKSEPQKFRSFWDLKRKWLLSPAAGSHLPAEVGPLYLNGQLNSHLEPQNAMFSIYYKGAYVLEMIRLLMEDRSRPEADQRFIEMMHDFVSTYANRNASTGDFEQMVEKHMGQRMDWFFNEYVYGTEIPTYNFQYNVKPTGDGKSIVQFTLTQSGVSDQFEMRVPLYATLGKRVVRLGLIPIKGSTSVNNQVNLPAVPDRISIDEYHDVLAVEHQ